MFSAWVPPMKPEVNGQLELLESSRAPGRLKELEDTNTPQRIKIMEDHPTL